MLRTNNGPRDEANVRGPDRDRVERLGRARSKTAWFSRFVYSQRFQRKKPIIAASVATRPARITQKAVDVPSPG